MVIHHVLQNTTSYPITSQTISLISYHLCMIMSAYQKSIINTVWSVYLWPGFAGMYWRKDSFLWISPWLHLLTPPYRFHNAPKNYLIHDLWLDKPYTICRMLVHLWLVQILCLTHENTASTSCIWNVYKKVF